jgi:hypothetical protein
LPTIDDEMTIADSDGDAIPLPHGRLGGRTRRKAPAVGLRPTVRFTIAFTLTLAWLAFSVWVSDPWRDELEAAIGPVMAWVIPIFLAYIPSLVIGFMIFTLLITRYQELPLEPPTGNWAEGAWPSVTIVVAAWNESQAIVRTLEHIGELSYEGRVEVVVADNNSTDDTALLVRRSHGVAVGDPFARCAGGCRSRCRRARGVAQRVADRRLDGMEARQVATRTSWLGLLAGWYVASTGDEPVNSLVNASGLVQSPSVDRTEHSCGLVASGNAERRISPPLQAGGRRFELGTLH